MEDLTVSLKAAAPVSRAIATFSTLALLAGLLAASGCGSSSKSTSPSTPAAPATSTTPSQPAAAGGAGHTLSSSANPEGQLKYSTSTLTAKSGQVAITFT